MKLKFNFRLLRIGKDVRRLTTTKDPKPDRHVTDSNKPSLPEDRSSKISEKFKNILDIVASAEVQLKNNKAESVRLKKNIYFVSEQIPGLDNPDTTWAELRKIRGTILMQKQLYEQNLELHHGNPGSGSSNQDVEKLWKKLDNFHRLSARIEAGVARTTTALYALSDDDDEHFSAHADLEDLEVPDLCLDECDHLAQHASTHLDDNRGARIALKLCPVYEA